MILSFEFRCKGTTFFSNIQKSRAEKELFYLYSLYIVHCSIVSYIELSVTEHLYSLSLGEGWGEVTLPEPRAAARPEGLSIAPRRV